MQTTALIKIDDKEISYPVMAGSEGEKAIDVRTLRKDTGYIFYDQGYAPNGELTPTLMTFSDDAGVTWSQPVPLTDRPFHAGYGNDTSTPNLGDYISATSVNGTLYTVWAGSPPRVGFADGQPGTAMTVPFIQFKKFTGPAPPAVDLGAVTVASTSDDGNLRPGDTASLTIVLRNPVTNALMAAPLTGINVTLSSNTPGVSIIAATSAYSDLAPNVTSSNRDAFRVALAGDFQSGTPIEFTLDIAADAGTVRRLFTRNTGVPDNGTVIFSEDFESATPGALPAGWQTSHGHGANTVPWTTSNSFCGTGSNGLFHINALDGRLPTSDPTRWERAYSPQFTVPQDAAYVTLDFDICYDTEDDPDLRMTGYDGATLRLYDATGGRTVRSVFTEAFAEEIKTGAINHFPKHLPDRSDNPNYFDGVSAWSGDSGGMIHVSMRLPGMAGSTVQMRWEYTQDETKDCQDVRPDSKGCGVLIDNIVVRSVVVR